jgi:hypothetical protein
MKIALNLSILAIVSIATSHGACYVSEEGTRYCDTYTQWSSGESGAVSWAKDCEFLGHDIEKLNVPVDTVCGKYCLQNQKCTHFTWLKGTCILKSNQRQKAEEPSKNVGAICGYMNERTDFVRVG